MVTTSAFCKAIGLLIYVGLKKSPQYSKVLEIMGLIAMPLKSSVVAALVRVSCSLDIGTVL